LVCFLLATSGVVTESQVVPAVLTLGGLIEGMQGLVKSIKDGAQDLLQAGDVDAAEQQMLLAATLERTIKNVQEAYSKSLNDTYDKLSSQEKTVYDHLKSLEDDARDIEKNTNQDVSDRIFQAQSAANQVLDRLPFVNQSPILVGVKVKSFLTSRDQNDADVAVLGYLLADKRLGYRKPDVKINGVPIPGDFVGAFYDRINIQIPDQIKEQIRFANSPCAPRKTFHVELTVHYLKPWFGVIETFSQTSLTLTANSLPGGILYDIKMTASANRTFTMPEPVAFSNVSAYTSVDCERTSSTNVSWTMPAEGKQLNGTAQWIERDGGGSESAHADVSGATIIASGSINGQNKNLFGNCPGGGHGRLQVSGTYYIDQTHQEPYEYKQDLTMISSKVDYSLPAEVALPPALTSDVRAGTWVIKPEVRRVVVGFITAMVVVPVREFQPAAAPSPSDAQSATNAVKSTLAYQKVLITVYRKNCDKVLDTIELNVPLDPNQSVTVTSHEGMFKATLQKGSLEVQRVQEI
jgi:hypothetical protein